MATRAYDAEERHRLKARRNRQAEGNAELICECADLRCNATLDLTTAEYEGRVPSPSRFLVKPGHGILSIERVLEENAHYAVVQRLGPS
jgi:hypothetical protein